MNHRTNAPRRVPDGDACACECLVSVCPGESSHIMHLAILQHTDLLPRSFQPLLALPQVYEAVVTQGRERPLARASLQPRVSAVMFASSR